MRDVVKRKKRLAKFCRFLSKTVPIFIFLTCAGAGCALAYCASIISLALWAPAFLSFAGALYEFVRAIEKNSFVERYFRRKAAKLQDEACAIERVADSHIDREKYRINCNKTDILHRQGLINRLYERKRNKSNGHPAEFYDKKIAENKEIIRSDRESIKDHKRKIKSYIADQNAVYDNYKKTGGYEPLKKNEEIDDEEISL